MALTLPQILSVGFAYRPSEFTTIAVDARYLDWGETKLFGDSVPDGGVGWESIFAVAVGVEHWVSDCLAVRAGYQVNKNPIPDPATLFNVQLPGIIQHTLSVGASRVLTDAITMDMALIYGFENSISGPVLQVPDTNVTLESEYVSMAFGMRVAF